MLSRCTYWNTMDDETCPQEKYPGIIRIFHIVPSSLSFHHFHLPLFFLHMLSPCVVLVQLVGWLGGRKYNQLCTDWSWLSGAQVASRMVNYTGSDTHPISSQTVNCAAYNFLATELQNLKQIFLKKTADSSAPGWEYCAYINTLVAVTISHQVRRLQFYITSPVEHAQQYWAQQ